MNEFINSPYSEVVDRLKELDTKDTSDQIKANQLSQTSKKLSHHGITGKTKS